MTFKFLNITILMGNLTLPGWWPGNWSYWSVALSWNQK